MQLGQRFSLRRKNTAIEHVKVCDRIKPVVMGS